jgi:hypothetical protein
MLIVALTCRLFNSLTPQAAQKNTHMVEGSVILGVISERVGQ